MKLNVNISIPFNQSITSLSKHKLLISQQTKIPEEEINGIYLIKKSVDARQKEILVHYTYEVFVNEPLVFRKYIFNYENVSKKDSILIIGAGPAGLFAALRLIELGMRPIVIERGKNVENRKLDISLITRKRLIDENSNFCFGEGGAGTYSDGKLYTRSTKKGDINRILAILHEHGASENILVDSHPHIGTDKLPSIIASIRNTIINYGGQIHYNKRVSDLIINDKIVTGVITNCGNVYDGKAVILATGHSARDVYEMLSQKNILIEPKPFAVGVRIEHPQNLIDSIQYHCDIKNEFLPASSYHLACQSGNKGVYSFCMCPGGTIVNASTSQNELVLNGMSNSLRNLPFANSGIVVSVEMSDLTKYAEFGVFAGVKFQEAIEKLAFKAGGGDYTAPAQRMVDFVENRISSNLNNSSYFLGIKSNLLHEILPSFIVKRMQEAFVIFGKKMKGFYTNQATLLGVETRTSSPIRIPRNLENLQHIQISNLYPSGEGSGYAGGIVSSAIDGERCAEAIIKKFR